MPSSTRPASTRCRVARRHPAHARHGMLAVVRDGDARRPRAHLGRRSRARETVAHRRPRARRRTARGARQRPHRPSPRAAAAPRPRTGVERRRVGRDRAGARRRRRLRVRAGTGIRRPRSRRVHLVLGQDLLYLREYARVLARAAALGPTAEEQRFWAAASASCLAEEARLHESHVDATALEPAPDTTAYTDHLHAVSGADRTPCWSPRSCRASCSTPTSAPAGAVPSPPTTRTPTGSPPTATRCSPRRPPRRPRIADAAARSASPAVRAAMSAAYARSMRLELAFFEAPLRR